MVLLFFYINSKVFGISFSFWSFFPTIDDDDDNNNTFFLSFIFTTSNSYNILQPYHVAYSNNCLLCHISRIKITIMQQLFKGTQKNAKILQQQHFAYLLLLLPAFFVLLKSSPHSTVFRNKQKIKKYIKLK